MDLKQYIAANASAGMAISSPAASADHFRWREAVGTAPHFYRLRLIAGIAAPLRPATQPQPRGRMPCSRLGNRAMTSFEIPGKFALNRESGLPASQPDKEIS
jgi:hypothetical protein